MATRMDLVQEVKTALEGEGINKLSKKEVGMVVDTILTTIEDITLNKGSVTVYPYKFKKKIKNARKGLNPRTGESIDIPEKTLIKFMKFEAKQQADEMLDAQQVA